MGCVQIAWNKPLPTQTRTWKIIPNYEMSNKQNYCHKYFISFRSDQIFQTNFRQINRIFTRLYRCNSYHMLNAHAYYIEISWKIFVEFGLCSISLSSHISPHFPVSFTDGKTKGNKPNQTKHCNFRDSKWLNVNWWSFPIWKNLTEFRDYTASQRVRACVSVCSHASVQNVTETNLVMSI